MVFDRTQKDVDDSIIIINEKVQKGLSLSEDEIATLERGTITINTLNRIEEKQAYLKSLFDSQAYYTKPIINHIWNYENIFSEFHFDELIKDTYILRDAFFDYTDTPKKLFVEYKYENINNLEKILFDLQRMMAFVMANYRECDTFYCGEE